MAFTPKKNSTELSLNLKLFLLATGISDFSEINLPSDLVVFIYCTPPKTDMEPQKIGGV